MNMKRIAELREELDNERISYDELSEIDSAYMSLPNPELDLFPHEMLNELAEAFYTKTHDALSEALSPLDLEWTVEGLMTRLRDVEAFSQNS